MNGVSNKEKHPHEEGPDPFTTQSQDLLLRQPRQTLHHLLAEEKNGMQVESGKTRLFMNIDGEYFFHIPLEMNRKTLIWN